MEISNLIPHIEALIFASDKPLTSIEITDLVNQAFAYMDDKVDGDKVDVAIEGIVEKYKAEFYPFEVRESGGGWQFLTKKDFHKTVAQLNGEKFLKRLSAAALETLAIIAYKQPVTKGEIEAIRGVSSDYAVQKLLEKELVIITGRNEKLPGHPLIYATSKSFMDYFGINSPEDLPKIREILADQVVEPTIIHHVDFEQSETFAVSDNGELINAELEKKTKDSENEGYLNGHTFELDETSEEPAMENEPEGAAEENKDELSPGQEETRSINDDSSTENSSNDAGENSPADKKKEENSSDEKEEE